MPPASVGVGAARAEQARAGRGIRQRSPRGGGGSRGRRPRRLPSMLGSAWPTSTPGSGAALMRGRPVAELEDDRGRVDGCVVVAVLDELRHVEEVAVERTRREVGQRPASGTT